jgi:Flp pilus assembly protein TadG
MRIRKRARNNSGQALIETALILPVLLLVILNAVNFGYFYLVALNLTSAARTASLYAMIGSMTPAGTALPPATGTSNVTASYLAYQDLTGSLLAPGNATIQVCSPNITNGVNPFNGTGSSQKAWCQTCTTSASGSALACAAAGAGSPAPDSDPEAPTFVLNRVDVTYTFSPIIPGTPFGLALLSVCPGGTCTFSRHLSMRAMGS